MRERSYHVLLERGLKLTKPRRAMLDYLLDRPGWQFQADELHRELNVLLPGMVSRATVYRTLELLADAGLVNRIQVRDHCFRYQLSEAELHACHYHLIDINTGASISFEADKELRRVLKRICKEQGFSEQYHVLEVFGEFARRRRVKPAAGVNGNHMPEQVKTIVVSAAPEPTDP
jgi:Fur family transcriptional regulator, ferric uptake regulator